MVSGLSNISDRQFTLELDGLAITVDKFRGAIDSFSSLLQETTTQLCGDQDSISWFVSVSPGSIRVDFTPTPVSVSSFQVSEVLDHLEHGFQDISKGNVPASFGGKALRYAKELASISGKNGSGHVTHVRILRGDRIADLAPEHAKTIESFLSKALTFRDWGSVDGRITTVSLAKGRYFSISDILLGGIVTCHFQEELLGRILKAFGKRVTVSGLIRYDHNGNIKAIDVDEIDIFPPNSALPTAADVFGLFTGA